jgi:AcrR family transcriptional regulator
VLRRNGYEATTMKDIAAQVNLTAASLYHHFTNKDSLLLAVLEGGLEHAIERIEPVVQSSHPYAQKLHEMARCHVMSLTQNMAVGAALVFEMRPLMLLKSPPRNGNAFAHDALHEFLQRRDRFFQRRDYFEELFRCVVRDGIAAGEFTPVNVPIFVKTMLGAHNWVGVWYKDTGALTGEQIADLMAETFVRALRA